MKWFKYGSIGMRLHCATLVALAAVFGLLLAGYSFESARIESTRIDLLRSVVQSATAIAAGFEKQQRDGTLTAAQAQHDAIQAIAAIRYLGDDYVWINDMHPTMVMHPTQPALNGTDLTGVADPHGIRLFVAAADTVRAHGSGVIAYLWPRPGSAEPVPKLSFVAGFQPWGWVIGTGVYVDDLAQARHTMLLVFAGIALVAGLLVGGVVWLTGRGIRKPLRALTAATTQIAGGNLQTAISGLDRHDELGDLAKALEVLKAGSLERIRLEHAAEDDRAARARRQIAMDAHTSDFGKTIVGVLARLADAAGTMNVTAQQIQTGNEQTRSSVKTTALQSSDSSRDLAAVASATVELSASVDEIARQVSHATGATQIAVSRAARTDETFVRLNQTAQRISEIVGAISGIAAQTNLLALNATIEAARAGEAGRGFAVVANEVKALAIQTSKATVEIAENIGAIRDATDETAKAIHAVSDAIQTVDNVATAIAAAVEQQGAATREIACTVQAVAKTGEQTSAAMEDMAGFAEVAGGMGQTVLTASENVSHVAQMLRSEVDDFFHAMPREEAHRRRHERMDVDGLPTTIVTADGRECGASITNICRGGAALHGSVTGSVGDPLKVVIPGRGMVIEGRLLRTDNTAFAMTFRQDQPNLERIDALIDTLPTSTNKAA